MANNTENDPLTLPLTMTMRPAWSLHGPVKGMKKNTVYEVRDSQYPNIAEVWWWCPVPTTDADGLLYRQKGWRGVSLVAPSPNAVKHVIDAIANAVQYDLRIEFAHVRYPRSKPAKPTSSARNIAKVIEAIRLSKPTKKGRGR